MAATNLYMMGCLALLGNILKLAGGQRSAGIVGYDLSPSKIAQPKLDSEKSRAVILESDRIFFSDGVKIKKIEAYWIQPGMVRFQVYRRLIHSEQFIIDYKLVAQTELLESYQQGLVEFNTTGANLVANYGDVLGIYYPELNPIAFVDGSCGMGRNTSKYYIHQDPPTTVGKSYYFLTPDDVEKTCTHFIVDIDTEVLNSISDVQYQGKIESSQDMLDTDASLLVINSHTHFNDGPVQILGWRAKIALSQYATPAKVRFVLLSSHGDNTSFSILYKSDLYYAFDQKEIEVIFGFQRQQTAYGPLVMGLLFKGRNPVPFETADTCTSTGQSLQIPFSDLSESNMMIKMVPRPIKPCRTYAFQLIYKEENTTGRPVMTTIFGPRECNYLRANGSEVTAESGTMRLTGEIRVTRKLECWEIVAPSGMYPRVNILQNNMQKAQLCDDYARDVVDIKEGRHYNGALLRRICDGSSNIMVDACAGNEIYLLVRISQTKPDAGIRFTYQAVSQAERMCGKPDKPVKSEASATFKSSHRLISLYLVVSCYVLIKERNYLL